MPLSLVRLSRLLGHWRTHRLMLALGAVLLVFSGHAYLIDRAGSPVPVHDQWQAEADFLYRPLLRGELTAAHFWREHGEHRIVTTRLLAVGLFELNQRRWDVEVQMTVNALLAALLAGLIVAQVRWVLGGRLTAWVAVPVAAALASALFYGNALWGFQAGFYFLLGGSLLHLRAVLTTPPGSRTWWLGVAAAVVAGVSMGSGFFSAAVVVVLTGLSLLGIGPRMDGKARLLQGLVHGLLVVVAWAVSPERAAVAPAWGEVFRTAWHALSWPHRLFTPWGGWVWLPFVVFAAVRLRTGFGRRDLWVLAVGGWVLAQVAAIAWTRSAPAVVMAQRYYDIFALGVLANGLAAMRLVRPLASGWTRRVAVGLALAWVAGVGTLTWRFAESHRRYDLPTLEQHAAAQVRVVRAFLAGGDAATLRQEPYPLTPHPDPGYLEGLLRDPALRAILPVELNDRPEPAFSRRCDQVRAAAIPIGVVGGLLLAAAMVGGELRRLRRSYAVQPRMDTNEHE